MNEFGSIHIRDLPWSQLVGDINSTAVFQMNRAACFANTLAPTEDRDLTVRPIAKGRCVTQ